MVLCNSYFFYFAIPITCGVKNDHCHHMCYSQAYYLRCIHTLVLHVTFQLYYLLLYYIGSYCHLACYCFCLSLVGVVDSLNSLVIHLICQENPFLGLEGTCPIQIV